MEIRRHVTDRSMSIKKGMLPIIHQLALMNKLNSLIMKITGFIFVIKEKQGYVFCWKPRSELHLYLIRLILSSWIIFHTNYVIFIYLGDKKGIFCLGFLKFLINKCLK